MKRITAVVLSVLVFGCTGAFGGEGGQKAPEVMPARYWPAVSVPHTRVTLSSKLDENILSVEVVEGQIVKKGQVLLRFDDKLIRARIAVAEVDADFEARLNAARAKAEYLAKEYKRSKDLGEYITDSDLDKAYYEAKIAEFDVRELERSQRLAQRQLDFYKTQAKDYVILSPIDGAVARVWVEAGEMAQQGQQLMEVIDPDVVEVRVHLPERYATQVACKQDALVRFPAAAGGKEFRGDVSCVAPYVDSSSGTYMVKVLVRPGTAAVKPGMACEVRFVARGGAGQAVKGAR